MNAAALLLAAVCGLSPESPLAADATDLIELNHCYNEDGLPVFRQLVFWEWSPRAGEYHVAAYRVLRSDSATLRYDWRRNEYVAAWCDNGVLREVRAAHHRVTWTQYDPELEDRQYFPQDRRRGLEHEAISQSSPLRFPATR